MRTKASVTVAAVAAHGVKAAGLPGLLSETPVVAAQAQSEVAAMAAQAASQVAAQAPSEAASEVAAQATSQVAEMADADDARASGPLTGQREPKGVCVVPACRFQAVDRLVQGLMRQRRSVKPLNTDAPLNVAIKHYGKLLSCVLRDEAMALSITAHSLRLVQCVEGNSWSPAVRVSLAVACVSCGIAESGMCCLEGFTGSALLGDTVSTLRRGFRAYCIKKQLEDGAGMTAAQWSMSILQAEAFVLQCSLRKSNDS